MNYCHVVSHQICANPAQARSHPNESVSLSGNWKKESRQENKTKAGTDKCTVGPLAMFIASAMTHHRLCWTNLAVLERHIPIFSVCACMDWKLSSSTEPEPGLVRSSDCLFFFFLVKTSMITGSAIARPPTKHIRSSTSWQLFQRPPISFGQSLFTNFTPDLSPWISHHESKTCFARSLKVLQTVASDEKYWKLAPCFFSRESASFRPWRVIRWDWCSRQSIGNTITWGISLAMVAQTFLANTSLLPRSVTIRKMWTFLEATTK